MDFQLSNSLFIKYDVCILFKFPQCYKKRELLPQEHLSMDWAKQCIQIYCHSFVVLVVDMLPLFDSYIIYQVSSHVYVWCMPYSTLLFLVRYVYPFLNTPRLSFRVNNIERFPQSCAISLYCVILYRSVLYAFLTFMRYFFSGVVLFNIRHLHF